MFEAIRSFFTRKKAEEAVPKKIAFLEHLIGYRITEPELYLRALRHRSRTGDEGYNKSDSYEQLEFLGDAVLDLAVTEILFDRFPSQDEGFMTKVRAKIVRGESLASFAEELNLSEIVEIGIRAKSQKIQFSKSILADVFEAIIGAIFRDKGYEIASKFIRRVVDDFVDLDEAAKNRDNFKSTLLEYSQARRWKVPVYEIIQEEGPDHQKTFEVEVYINDKPYGKGTGRSKKRAEQNAAKQALTALKQI